MSCWMAARRMAAGLLLLLGSGARVASALDQQRLPAPSDIGANGRFGGTVTASRDVIAVGAYLAHGGTGAVYLYRRDVGDGTWKPFDSQPSPLARGGQLGFSLALATGENGGLELFVGAPFAGGCGAVYRAVVSVSPASGRVGPLVPFTFSDGFCAQGAEIGSSLSAGGGLLAIGARGADGRAGRVYVCRDLSCDRVPAAAAPGDELGQSVAIDGNRLVVGATFAASGALPGTGAAYLFTRSGGGWAVAPLQASPGAGEAFGYAVAMQGDRIAVGAPLADGESGAVYLFTGDAPPLRVAGTGREQRGVSVAIADAEILAGARWAGPPTRAGAVYEISGGGAAVRLPDAPTVAGAEFGFDLARAGDVLLVGAFMERGTGAAYVFSKPVPHPGQQVTVGLKPATVEVKENAGTASVPVTLTIATDDLQPPATTVIVTLATADGTATAPGDYTGTSRTVKIKAGDTRTEIPVVLTVQIVNDSLCEGDETFSVHLAVPPGTLLGSPSEEVVVIHDTSAALTLSPGPLLTTEGGPPVPFTVALSCAPVFPVTVNLSPVSLSTGKSPGSVVVPQALTFAMGVANQQQTATVQSLDNASCEPNPSYMVTAMATSNDSRYGGLTATVEVIDSNDDLRCLSGAEFLCTYSDGTVLYAFTLENSGHAAVPDVPAAFELFDPVPAAVSVVTASASDGVATVDSIANSVGWNGIVPGHGSVTIWIVGALVPGPPVVVANQADTITFDRDGRPPLEQLTIPVRMFTSGEVVCDSAFPFP